MKKRSPHVIVAMLLLTGCSTDIIDHNGGGIGNRNGDAGPRDSGPTPVRDAGSTPVRDAGPIDTGPCTLDTERRRHTLGIPVGTELRPAVGVFAETSAPCVIDDVYLLTPGTDFSLELASTQITVQPGDTAFIEFVYRPTTVGETTNTLRVVVAGGATVDFQLTGVGIPPEIPSRQNVVLDVQNTSNRTLYLVTGGWNCDPLEVLGIDLGVTLQCYCGCPPLPAPVALEYRRLDPGAKHEITWDARKLVRTSFDLHCEDGSTVTAVDGSPQPVDFGQHIFVVAFEDTMPAGCTVDGDFVRCELDLSTHAPGPPIAQLCPATHYSEVAVFTIPASGDVVVPVPIAP